MTDAVLKLEGTMPDSKEELIMLTMVEQRMGRHALTRPVGVGSTEMCYLNVFICLIIQYIYTVLISTKKIPLPESLFLI